MDAVLFGEVLFYTQLTVGQAGNHRLVNVALVRSFSPPDQVTLQESYTTVSICESLDAILVVEVQNIISVVGMVPVTQEVADGEPQLFFAVEKPGLSISSLMGRDIIADDEAEIENVE